ncbi:MAG: ATP phosphoribosyltransferase [Rhodospirillales bacterium]|nr:ATP phosphoribosyltransferase [Rhodospirillales bacterium]
MNETDKLVLALPKGRILSEVMPILERLQLKPEPAFIDESTRQLRFTTNDPGLDIIRVRSFDVATFVAFGGAELGVAGRDVLMEFDYPEVYAPIDLGIGRCRISVAEPRDLSKDDDPRTWSHIRVATKYPTITQRHFGSCGVQAECIKLNGALELAPGMGLCRRIVDLVSTGGTLAANDLVEVDVITEVTSHLIVNRTASKTRPGEIARWIEKIRRVVKEQTDAA